MTEAKALRFIPPAALGLYHLLVEQGDTPREAMGNVLTALQGIMKWTPRETTGKRRQQRR